MNWDQIEGNWKQMKGKAKAQWGDLTDDELDTIEGRREELAGRFSTGGQWRTQGSTSCVCQRTDMRTPRL